MKRPTKPVFPELVFYLSDQKKHGRERLLKRKIWGLKSPKQFVSGRLHPFFIAEQSSVRLRRETKQV